MFIQRWHLVGILYCHNLSAMPFYYVFSSSVHLKCVPYCPVILSVFGINDKMFSGFCDIFMSHISVHCSRSAKIHRHRLRKTMMKQHFWIKKNCCGLKCETILEAKHLPCRRINKKVSSTLGTYFLHVLHNLRYDLGQFWLGNDNVSSGHHF